MSSKCPQQITPFRSQAPNEMRLRQRVKGSLPNLPLEACLSSTGWYVWKSRRLAALSHVTIAVGAPALSPVTESCVARESVYLVYGPRASLEWWRRYGRLHTAHTALGSVSRAPVTHGGTRGRIRGQSGAQDRARRRNLGEEMRSSLGTLRNLESSWRLLGGEREHFKVLANLCYNKYNAHIRSL